MNSTNFVSMNSSEISARAELRRKLQEDAEKFLQSKQATTVQHGVTGLQSHYVISKPKNRKRGSK